MLPLICIGIVAALFFGLLSFSAAGKFYYLLGRYKKNPVVPSVDDDVEKGGSVNNGGGAWLLCCRKASPVHDNVSRELSGRGEDVEMGFGLAKSIAEEGVEAELMRLHNLCGPPRFLFTIKEETVEDLASDDGRTTTRLIDLMRAADANFLSPVASPARRSPIYSNGFLNPLFECSVEAEVNRLRASPPPKFKFMRDAEEKLRRKLEEEAAVSDRNQPM